MPLPGTAKILVRLSDGTVEEHELRDQVMSIGRDQSCDICIPSHYVSRRHAIISPVEDRFVIQDEQSTNGLQINGQIVREPHPLAAGDRVVLGDVSLTYEEAPEDPFATAVYPILSRGEAQRTPQAPEPSRAAGLPRHSPRPAGLCTILFTDLVDHTRLVTRLGDLAGQRWLHVHANLLREQFERYQGLEEKWTGDGFLVTFASARLAVECAVALHKALKEYNRLNPDSEMHIRAGLHTGEVLREENELFGNAVILASRVMARASADEVLLSELMYRLVQPTGEFTIVERGLFAIKGLPQRQRLFEVKWQEDDPQ